MVWGSRTLQRQQATLVNSNPERFGVGLVKWPALGSTAQKTLPVLHRSYSLSGRASYPGWPGGRADVGLQRDWLLIHENHGLCRIVRPLIRLPKIFHLGDKVFSQFRHAPHSFPATA